MSDSNANGTPDEIGDRNCDSSARRARLRESLATNPFWALVVFSGMGFAVTCLMSVAATLGDRQGPMNQLVTAYGMTSIVWEAGILIVSGLLAMTVDRLQTLRRARAPRQ